MRSEVGVVQRPGLKRSSLTFPFRQPRQPRFRGTCDVKHDKEAARVHALLAGPDAERVQKGWLPELRTSRRERY